MTPARRRRGAAKRGRKISMKEARKIAFDILKQADRERARLARRGK